MRVADRAGALGALRIAERYLGRRLVGAVSASVGFFPRDEYFMRLALREAERALEHDDVPIGAVIVHDGEVIAAARNERELRGDPTAHAEVLALREASARLGTWRLLDTVLYVTLEPCAMCAGAIVLARVPRVVYAADDPKAGAAGSVLDVLAEPRLNHRPEVAARPAGRRGRRICCAHSSLQSDRSAPYLPIRNTMSVDPKAILQRIESTYGPLAEGVPSVAYVYEPGVNGQCLYISPSIERVLGFAQEVWIKDGGLWDRLLHPEDADRVISNEAECARSGEALVQEYRISRADGRVVWIRDEMTVVRGEDGQSPPLFYGVFLDVTDRKKMEAELERLALYDSLTGLPNRALFSDRLRARDRAPRPDARHGRLFRRRGPLQADQRQPRPRGRRRGPARGRRTHPAHAAAGRHGRPLRRRRVHRPVRVRGRRARGRGRGGPASARDRAAAARRAAPSSG